MTSTNKQKMLAAFSQQPDSSTNVLSELKGNKLWITFNRPKRYNAFALDMYQKFTNQLKQANNNDQVKFIIINGNAGNYSSGNDLNNFIVTSNLGLPSDQSVQIIAKILFDLTEAILQSKKPIFAITEGKTIGFAFTQLLLYDRVFAVKGGQYTAPLVKLAQGPEMCSSFTFPKRFGQKIGEHLIMSGEKVDAAFLEKHGIVEVCQSRKDAEQRLEKHLSELDELNWPSYLAARELFRAVDRDSLDKANKAQIDNLIIRWSNPEIVTFLIDYLKKVKAKPKL